MTPQERQFLDQLLDAWQRHSGKINTFQCEFTRWAYDPTFGPRNSDGQLLASTVAYGELKYVNPDKGLFHVKKLLTWQHDSQRYQPIDGEPNEHWICDGQSVWEMNHERRQLIQNRIPPELQGRQIAEGPLPFMLFGAEAEALKARYFLRERTDPRYAQEEIWLEAYPRRQADAANYRSAQLIMKRDRFLPYALRLYLPDGNAYTVFEFTKVKINDPFLNISQPRLPRGWQLVEENEEGTRG